MDQAVRLYLCFQTLCTQHAAVRSAAKAKRRNLWWCTKSGGLLVPLLRGRARRLDDLERAVLVARRTGVQRFKETCTSAFLIMTQHGVPEETARECVVSVCNEQVFDGPVLISTAYGAMTMDGPAVELWDLYSAREHGPTR